MIDLIAYDEEYLGVDVWQDEMHIPHLIVSRRQEDENETTMTIDIYVKGIHGWDVVTTYEQTGDYDDLYDSWAVSLQFARDDAWTEVWKVRNPL